MDKEKIARELLKIANELLIRDRSAADWKPPKLNKTLAKQVAKNVDRHWSVTGVKSLDDIRRAIGRGVAMGARNMQEQINMQKPLKAWMASLSRKELLQMFRLIEEALYKGRSKGYRKTDEALNKLR